MTADTPRTDAVFTGIEPDNRDGRIMAALNLARQLERELAECRERLEKEYAAREHLVRVSADKKALQVIDELRLRAERAEAELADCKQGSHMEYLAHCRTQERCAQAESRLAQIDSAKVGLSAEEIECIRTRPRFRGNVAIAETELHELCDQAIAAIRMRPSERVLRLAKQVSEMMGGSMAVGDAAEMARELLRINSIAGEGKK